MKTTYGLVIRLNVSFFFRASVHFTQEGGEALLESQP